MRSPWVLSETALQGAEIVNAGAAKFSCRCGCTLDMSRPQAVKHAE